MPRKMTRPEPTAPTDEFACNGPTPERLTKTMFTHGAPRRVLTTVQALINSGDVDQDCADAGERWFRDYTFAFFDYVEYREPWPVNNATRHDAVSWHVLRAMTCARVANVRRALGAAAELRLRLVYVEELSFVKMGKILFPHLSATVARGKTSAQIALVLEQLRDFYNEEHKNKKKEIEGRMQLC
ncbi:hypothetical protein N5W20_06910 [Candidatus Kirkpatrickella diaphorinae]|uniref:Uncharacterized protein n=1 Tax=Candidatus Kirkpatrickella diaphorinae TaxID=2984322 RepID=A0ABY6GHE2_9PROT|nr:hypothetical protein [Candidatus Kirkpatrickella diaphorinae]UYH50835.1 hypothetical protein N5W20_06910 [Candidatus Kirkpatrickella diaphorinae]